MLFYRHCATHSLHHEKSIQEGLNTKIYQVSYTRTVTPCVVAPTSFLRSDIKGHPAAASSGGTVGTVGRHRLCAYMRKPNNIIFHL